MAVLMAAGAVVLLAVFETSRKQAGELRTRIEQTGVRTDASIVEAGRTSGEDKRRYAVYRYEAAGKTWAGRVTLRKRDHRPAARGDRLPVRYLPDEPGSNWVAGYEPSGPPLVVALLVPPLSLSGALALAWILRRQWALLADGRATEALITGFKKNRSDKGTRYHVEYEFRMMSGAMRRVKIESTKQPVEGTKATLLYDRENPRRHGVYPLSLVKVGHL
jgi:hypothetical protein